MDLYRCRQHIALTVYRYLHTNVLSQWLLPVDQVSPPSPPSQVLVAAPLPTDSMSLIAAEVEVVEVVNVVDVVNVPVSPDIMGIEVVAPGSPIAVGDDATVPTSVNPNIIDVRAASVPMTDMWILPSSRGFTTILGLLINWNKTGLSFKRFTSARTVTRALAPALCQEPNGQADLDSLGNLSPSNRALGMIALIYGLDLTVLHGDQAEAVSWKGFSYFHAGRTHHITPLTVILNNGLAFMGENTTRGSAPPVAREFYHAVPASVLNAERRAGRSASQRQLTSTGSHPVASSTPVVATSNKSSTVPKVTKQRRNGSPSKENRPANDSPKLPLAALTPDTSTPAIRTPKSNRQTVVLPFSSPNKAPKSSQDHSAKHDALSVLTSLHTFTADGVPLFEHPGFNNCSLSVPPGARNRELLFRALADIYRQIASSCAIDPESQDSITAYNRLLFFQRAVARQEAGPLLPAQLRKSNLADRLLWFNEGINFQDMLSDSLILFPLTSPPKERRHPKSSLSNGPLATDHDPPPRASFDILDNHAALAEYLSSLGANPLEEKQSHKVQRYLQAGLISKAAQALQDTRPVAFTADIRAELQVKFPPSTSLHPSAERPCPTDTPPLQISLASVLRAAKRMNRATSTGPDNLNPDILLFPFRSQEFELTTLEDAAADPSVTCSPEVAFIVGLHALINVIAQGKIPSTHRSFFFSGTGFALEKGDGQHRPIAAGSGLRRLVARCIIVQLQQRIQDVLGESQFATGYPNGIETCKLGIEESLAQDNSTAVLWIDFQNAFNSMDRSIIREAVHLYIPELAQIFWASYEIATKVTFLCRMEDGSRVPGFFECVEGVQQGDPLGPIFYTLGQRLLEDLLLHSKHSNQFLIKSPPVDTKSFSPYAISHQVWQSIVARFLQNKPLQEALTSTHIQSFRYMTFNPPERQPPLRLSFPSFSSSMVASATPTEGVGVGFGVGLGSELDLSSTPPEPPPPPAFQCKELPKAYMDDQYVLGDIGTLALSFNLRFFIAQLHANLAFNINPNKSKTGIFISDTSHLVDLQVEALPALFRNATIVTPTTDPAHRGLVILGSPLRQSSPEFIEAYLTKILLSALNEGPANLVRHPFYQTRFQLFQRSFVHRFPHIFRTLPQCFTRTYADRLTRLFLSLFDVCTATGPTPSPGPDFLTNCRVAQIFLPYNLGGMGVPNPAVLPYTARFGSLWSVLSEGSSRFAASFPSLSHLTTDNLIDDLVSIDPGSYQQDSLKGSIADAINFLRFHSTRPSESPTAAVPVLANHLSHLVSCRPDEPLSFKDLRPSSGANSDARRDEDGDFSCTPGQLARHVHEGIHTRLLLDLHTATQHPTVQYTHLPTVPDLYAVKASRRRQSIITGSAQHASLPFVCCPTDFNSTLNNAEWQHSVEVRLVDDFAAARATPYCLRCKQSPTPHTQGGWHFVSSCKPAAVGQREHKAIQEVIHSSFKQHSYAQVSRVTRGQVYSKDNRHTDLQITLFGRIPVFIDVSTTCPLGVSNQQRIQRSPMKHSRNAGSTPSTAVLDSSTRVLVSAAQREAEKVKKHEAICIANGASFLPFVVETTGGFGPRTADLEKLYRSAIEARSSADDLHADILIKKFRKDIAFALRKAHFTTISSAVQKPSVTGEWRRLPNGHAKNLTLRWIHSERRFRDL